MCYTVRMKTSDNNAAITRARHLLFAMLAKVSAIDGVLEGREAGLVVDLLKFAGDDRESCLDAFGKARRSRKSLSDYAVEFVALGLSERRRRDVYDLLWRTAIADGVLRATEKYLLRDACTRLALPSDAFGAAYERHRIAFADEELNDPGT